MRNIYGSMGIPHPVELDRAHRVGPLRTGSMKGPKGPRPIVARFTRFADREHALRMAPKLKGNANKIFVREDLCQASLQKINDQREDYQKAKDEGKIAYFSYTKLVTRPNTKNIGANANTLGTNSSTNGAKSDSTRAPAQVQRRKDAPWGGAGRRTPPQRMPSNRRRRALRQQAPHRVHNPNPRRSLPETRQQQRAKENFDLKPSKMFRLLSLLVN